MSTNSTQAPMAMQKPHVNTYHGKDYPDPYHWMRSMKRDDPEVLDHLKKENEFAEHVEKSFEDITKAVFAESVSRIVEDDSSVPYTIGGPSCRFEYYHKFQKGLQYPIRCRRQVFEGENEKGPEEVVLDLNLMEEKFLDLEAYVVSPDNTVLAHSLDTVGFESYFLRFKTLMGDQAYAEEIKDVYGMEWINDNKHVVYTTRNEKCRVDKLWLHKLGDDPKDDRLLFEEPDELYSVEIAKSDSEEYIFIRSAAQDTSLVHYIKAEGPPEELMLLHPKEEGVTVTANHHGDNFLMHHNYQSTNFKLSKVAINSPDYDKSRWQDITTDPKVHLSEFSVFANFLALIERVKGGPQLRFLEVNSETNSFDPSCKSHAISFEEEDYNISIEPRSCQDYHSTVCRVIYCSRMTPSTTIDYDCLTKVKKVLRIAGIPADLTKYLIKRHTIPLSNVQSKTCDPSLSVTLVYRKDLMRQDGTNPCYIYGYGSYGHCLDASCPQGNPLVSLIDRGFICAFVRVRGGEDNSRDWYSTEGKFLKKKNTFEDFILATEWLIKEKYTSSDRLVLEGRSAGGMLVGACINMRPELYKAFVAGVPFVDVINTMWDETIPLTTGEFREWGNPKETEYFDYMMSYSPYDNIRTSGKYPAGRVTAGLHDYRVAYWEPAKWTARLRSSGVVSLTDQDNCVHFSCNMGTGHFSSTGRYAHLEDKCKDWAFVIAQCAAASSEVLSRAQSG